LDLESLEDRAKLADAALFLRRYEDRLVVLDEIHRAPELFQTLRVMIDEGRRAGRATGRFLILGSASMDLLRQSGESLAGRITYVEMNPFDVIDVQAAAGDFEMLWMRGGFPESYLAQTERDSFAWRKDFIRTYLERDIPQFGPRVPAETLGRLWTMLAHVQASLLNASRLASALILSAQSVTRYIDLLADLLLVRRLPPFHANVRKRLVKSPKVYVRDSGIVHALLGIPDHETIAGHPVLAASWEGFVIENLITAAPPEAASGFYRTSAGAEVDCVLDIPGKGRWVIEIKRGLAPKMEKGFHVACADLNPTYRFVIYSGRERYPLTESVDAIASPR
jgi:predicted AAA+ superfamily ATPase